MKTLESSYFTSKRLSFLFLSAIMVQQAHDVGMANGMGPLVGGDEDIGAFKGTDIEDALMTAVHGDGMEATGDKTAGACA